MHIKMQNVRTKVVVNGKMPATTNKADKNQGYKKSTPLVCYTRHIYSGVAREGNRVPPTTACETTQKVIRMQN